MKIKRIQLKNGYKRFKDLTIDLGDTPARIIALVGPNGCGKSSVFDGMLYKNNSHYQIGSTGNKDYKFHSMFGDPSYNASNIQIEFDKGAIDQVFSSLSGTGKEKTLFCYRNPYRYNSELNIQSLSAISHVKNNDTGASSSIDLDSKMSINYQRLHVYFYEHFKKNEVTFKQTNAAILGELNSILKDCLELEISDVGDILGGKGSLYFRKSDQQNEFKFDVLSSGEKEVVDLLIDLYVRKDDYNDTIYLIDEPELHLNTNIQRKLLLAINKLVPENCQIWIATHSIGFLTGLQNDLNDECQIINFKGNYAQEQTTVTQMIKNRQNWQELFQTALEDLTGLLAPKKIIYCEGKREPDPSGNEQGLDAEIYNSIFSEEFQDTLFVSSGGSTEPEKYSAIALTVLNKAFKEVNLYCLKDMDINADGSPTTEVQRQDFLNKDPKNRMLKRREIENYLFDIEILSKYFPTIQVDKYKKIVTDIKTEDVKEPKTGEIMRLLSITGTTRGLNKNQLKQQLAKHITPDTTIYEELKGCIFSLN